MSSPAAAEPCKRTIERPKTRETLGKYRARTGTAAPGFRERRKSVDAPLLRIVGNLQKKYGWTYVAEAGLRQMIYADTGILPGQDTVRRALNRLARLGYLHQVDLEKGGVMPGGGVADAGVRLIRVAMSRAERHAFMARSRNKKREKTTGRVNHRAMFELMTAKREVAPTPAPADGQRVFEERRQAAIIAARKLQLDFAALDAKPPS